MSVPESIDIEKLIPHRDRMKLIHSIVEITENSATTESIPEKDWPLAGETTISPLILVELVAQTAAVCIGWREYRKKSADIGGKGWIVGIKKAEFLETEIPLNKKFRTRSEEGFHFENLTEIHGVVELESRKIASIVLQVFKGDDISEEK